MTFAVDAPIRVMVVAPQMTRWGLEQLVQSAPRMLLSASAGSLAEVQRDALADADVLIADFDDAREQTLLDTAMALTTARFILLTSVHGAPLLDHAVIAGVRGIVRKSDPPQLLVKAIERVHAGELWLDRSATSRLFMEMVRRKAVEHDDPDTARISTLTQRERQTIAALAADTGSPGKVIAGRLCISEHTLRNHLSSIYSKLELSNRLDLYAFATRHHLDKPA